MSDVGAPAGRPHWRTILMVVVAALTLGVVAALIVTLGDANRQRDRALDLQARSFEVMNLARGLAGSVSRAEATLGRFVISGDRAIGGQYYDQWVQASQQIDRLDQLTVGTAQQRRVDALRAAYRERGEELALIALSTSYGQNNQALSRFYAARDSTALTRIQRLLDGFIASERAELAERTQAAMRSVERSNMAAAAFAAVGVLLVLGAIALGWLTVRAIADRAAAAAEAMLERSRAEDLEAAVAAATAELQAEIAERTAAEEKLRQFQKLEAVGQLTGGIAHDFNNMLAVVLGGIELARRRALDRGGHGEVIRHLDSAAEGASRASALTRRLLAFARSEPLDPQPTDPAALITGMRDLLDRTLGDAIRVETRDEARGWAIFVDRHGLENALLNLAVNARDAMEGRGALTITTGGATLAAREIGACAGGDYTTIAVTDTGCGMTADVVARVFEPFFTTKPVGKGTGLGLSQIFGFVRQSGGEVGIRSAPGEGTTVTLYLPRHLAGAALPIASLPRVEVAPTAHGLDVIVIEDDPRVLASTMAALTELGHRPVACSDPLMASTIATTIAPPPDLIVTDVLMPGKTGPEIIAELEGRLPDTAVLFVTGFAGEAAEQDLFSGHAILRKPFTIAGLAAGIDEALTRRDAARSTELAAE